LSFLFLVGVWNRERNDEQMRVAISAEAEAADARGRKNELEQTVAKVRVRSAFDSARVPLLFVLAR
jgi:hypothetical protein